MASLKKIVQSITYKQKKHMLIMVSLVSLILVSFYAFFSITDRTNTIDNRTQRMGVAHTSLFVDKYTSRLSRSDKVEWAQNFATHVVFAEYYLDSVNGVNYRYVDFLPNDSEGYRYYITGEMFLVAHDTEGANYTVMEGKKLDELGEFEIAVTKEYASYLRSRGIDPLNHEVKESLELSYTTPDMLDSEELKIRDVTFKIVSVVDYPNYEMSFSPIKDLQDIDLFKEINNIPAITSASTITNLFDDVKIRYGINPEDENFDNLKSTYKLMRLYYDKYTPSKEKEIVETIINATGSDEYNIVNPNIQNIESFDELVSRNPLTESLLTVVVRFVVGGVLISGLYALYIQFKNQINENSKTLGLYALTGVKMSNITRAYFIEILGVALLGFGIGFVIISGLSQVLSIFRISPYLFGRISLVLVCLILILYGMVKLQLRSIFKKGLSKSKVGSGYQFRIASTTSTNLVRNLSWIQTLKHLPINLGMAFSIALTSTVLILTVSSSLIMTNLYTKDTFGIRFDYMLPSSNGEVYRLLHPMTKDQTFVSKSKRMFTDYNIDGGMGEYYKSSVITFHNFLEPYVQLVDGEYPINYSSPEMLYIEVGKKPLMMVSRRHFDQRNLHISGEKGKKLESGFVFSTDGYNLRGSVESVSGSRVTGSLNVLLDRGWMAYETLPSRDMYINEPHVYLESMYDGLDIMLHIEDDTDPKEFEKFLEDNNIDYLSYDYILDQFNEINKSMNRSAIETSLSVAVLLGVLSLLSLIAIVTHIRKSREKDFKLYTQIGIMNVTLTRMKRMEALIRVVVTGLTLLLMVAILYPIMIGQLKKAFGLFTLPYQFYSQILIVVAIFVLIASIALVYYQRKGGKAHVEN